MLYTCIQTQTTPELMINGDLCIFLLVLIDHAYGQWGERGEGDSVDIVLVNAQYQHAHVPHYKHSPCLPCGCKSEGLNIPQLAFFSCCTEAGPSCWWSHLYTI